MCKYLACLVTGDMQHMTCDTINQTCDTINQTCETQFFSFFSLHFLTIFDSFCIVHTIYVHSRFRGSVNCRTRSLENRFQVAKFSFEVQKSSILFCQVQNGPGVTWVVCIGLRDHSQSSLGCERVFLEEFLDLL